MTVEKLQDLRAATNEVLFEIKKNKFTSPVNWGDLFCSEALWVLNHYGEARAQVIIEEAAPEGNEKLHSIVVVELEKRGWPNVEVFTEW